MTIHPEMTVALEGETDVVVTRAFGAPPFLVYRAFAEPALVRQWMLGPDGWDMPVCEIDLRPGGAYRYRWKNRETGAEFGFVGTFNEIEPNRRIVQSERPDWNADMPPALNTMVLQARGGATLCTLRMHYASPEIRKTVLETGMTDGMRTTYNRLDDILTILVAT